MQPVCSPRCAIEKVKSDKRKKNKANLKKFNLENRTKPQWIKVAQKPFNEFIRLDDVDKPCISCGRYDHEILYSGVGGKWDCGHYLSVGARPELRFTKDNAHKQCKSCNGGAGNITRKDFTVTQAYRENLIIKIGLERVEWLEGPHPIPNWTIDDLKQIEIKYKKKLKMLKMLD